MLAQPVETIDREDRLLGAGDEHNLERFLAAQGDGTLLMLSNLRTAGLIDRGEFYQGTYAARLWDGAVSGVVGHFWNGMALLQANEGLGPLLELAVGGSGRRLSGFYGPAEQVAAAKRTLGLAGSDIRHDSLERLYALDLAQLARPNPLADGEVRCRRPRSSELELLMNWRVAMSVEVLGAKDTAETHAESKASVQAHFDGRSVWVLERRGRLVSTCSVIGQTERAVQIGGVWTPEALRGRGFARAVVAGALAEARRTGHDRACLISANPAAERAYRALGFAALSEVGLVLLNGER
ncbi:MAG: GNAT family N-acetyltransferase [Pseudomonadota bacterium]